MLAPKNWNHEASSVPSNGFPPDWTNANSKPLSRILLRSFVDSLALDLVNRLQLSITTQVPLGISPFSAAFINKDNAPISLFLPRPDIPKSRNSNPSKFLYCGWSLSQSI